MTGLRIQLASAGFLLTTVVAGCLSPTAQEAARSASFDSARAWRHLEALVGIGPRPAGSAGIRQARAYITRQLSALGLTVLEQPFVAETPLGPVEMVNLVIRLPGSRPDRLLFAGHYDTKLFRDRRFVGASDGGSSAAFLIELSRILLTRSRAFTYEFVWFDGEEAFVSWSGSDHTYGSRYYVQAAREANALASIRALVLVDMIGDRDLTIRRESASTPWLTDILWSHAARLGHADIFLDEATPIEDDHVPFLEAGVPAVNIIDLDYPAWHTTADTLDAVSARSLQIVGDVLLAAVPAIETTLAARAPR
jgi:Zn-dependent M28 family amino/carboxypeptidase